MLTKKTRNKLITSENLQDFDWNKTKLFYHIVKCGGFVKAALLTGISQGALTRQIQYLENQVGCPLLIRRPGGITLTRKGEELLEMVTPYFLMAKGFFGPSYMEVAGERRRKIRIVTPHALAAYIIGDLMLDYNKENPRITFEIIGDDHEIDVILNDADIVIRPYDPLARGVQQELLFSLEKKLYTSRNYLDKYGEPQTVDDLKNHHLIVNSFNPEQYPFSDILWILRLGLPKGKFHNPSFISNSLELAISAAKKGEGIVGTYEEMSIVKEAQLINILPNVIDKKIECYFIYPNYVKEDSEIIALKTYLKNKFLS
jgi:DNA-binding transcriptional LysR family regulator